MATNPVPTSTHRCPGCGTTGVPRHQLACKPCWFELPADLRNAVNGSFHRRSSDPAAHRRAIVAALDWFRRDQWRVNIIPAPVHHEE